MSRLHVLLAALLALPLLPAVSAESVCREEPPLQGCIEAGFHEGSTTSGYVWIHGTTPALEGGVRAEGGYHAGGLILVQVVFCRYDELNGWQCEEFTRLSRNICDNPLALCV